MTGLREKSLAAALALAALSCAFVVAAAAFPGLPSAARLLLGCAALTISAAFFAALKFLRSLSRSLARLLETPELGGAGNPPNPARPGIALESLEKALREMAADMGRRAQEARGESVRRLAILDGMPEAVLAMDRGLVLHLANRRARSLFALGDWRGSTLLKATRCAALEEAAKKVLEEGRPREAELRLRGHRGELIFRALASPLADPSGAADGVVVALEDVTRLSRLERTRKDFVANVSHELRTPIQLIKGFSETLLDDPAFSVETPEGKRRRPFMKIIRRNARAMENLTRDLLALASLENMDGDARGVLGEKKTQPLAPLFAEAASRVRSRAKKRAAKITVSCPEDMEAAVYGPLLVQALANLFDNAIKYSPKKSRVQASAFRKNGETVLEVRDEGMGIPAEHMGRIFERFYRVDRDRSRKSGGTGLGLAIVRHVALLHGGRAEVESHSGEGSAFRIVLGE